MATEQDNEIQDRARPAKKVSARLAREHARKEYSPPERPFPGLERVDTTPTLENGRGGAPHMEDVGVDETPGTGPGEGGPIQIEPQQGIHPDDRSPVPEYFKNDDQMFTESNVVDGEKGEQVISQAPLDEDQDVVKSFNPNDHTVEEVKQFLATYPDEEKRIMRAEKRGQARVGLVGHPDE